MKIIETKRHPLKFYTTLTFGFLFLFALGSFMIFIGLNNEVNDQSKYKHIIMPIFGSLVCLLAIWMVYSYWKNSPKITIDKNNLKIGNETFRLNSIKDVILTGKMPFRFIINFPMEGTAILFDDGKDKILFDDMYTNSYEVKSFLEQVIINKQEFKINTPKKVNSRELRFENKEVFKGNQFTSLRGISLWALIGTFAFPLIIKGTSMKFGALIFLCLFGTFWFALHSWLMHYFELTKNFLIIRNHNFIWKMKVYGFSDIKEIVFETQGNQPNCMRVITNDFKNNLYPAGTLRDKIWLEMKKKLEAKGVQVRNECIYE
ncbi:hypothetical protein [Nonlabens ulvanivorans]|uniref:Transmembrane protein n=1 Tax=Nonlabens ulvanivorans TaxID=906888 RepID=A0A084JWN8_NONUL|nr:hypothetical protein [Nonlabens ulvanivorans]KEZ93372.1 hypothetical protein IL45_03900 [Nonlabens ulvanivorans]PRX13954.1 hypothetical protein LY02_00983 [Nonlabens ulvanivorans]